MTHYPGLVVAVLEGLVAGLVDEELLAPLLETVSFFLPSLFASSAAFFSSSVLVMNLRGLCRKFTWHQLTWPTRVASWNSSFPPRDRTPLLLPLTHQPASPPQPPLTPRCWCPRLCRCWCHPRGASKDVSSSVPQYTAQSLF